MLTRTRKINIHLKKKIPFILWSSLIEAKKNSLNHKQCTQNLVLISWIWFFPLLFTDWSGTFFVKKKQTNKQKEN